MFKEKVGYVTEHEKIELKVIFERKSALEELLLTLNDPFLGNKDYLNNKIVIDIEEAKKLLASWWSKKSDKYKWKGVVNGQWLIDFKTNEIFLSC